MENDTPGSRRSSELSILKDIPYGLLGMNTKTLNFADNGTEIILPATLPPPLATFLHQLCEPAMLYRTIIDILQATPQGKLQQALFNCVTDQLSDYQVLVGEIESRIRQGGPASTLPTVAALTSGPTVGLRVLYRLLADVRERPLVGGPILSLLYQYTYSGDPLVSNCSKELVDCVQQPFNLMLLQWTGTGSFDDPHGEFFVELTNKLSKWENRFSLDEDKAPIFMPESMLRNVFEAGKAVYFVRELCGEHDFELTTDISGIDTAFNTAMKRATSLLNTKYHLQEHLRGLKTYMLLEDESFVRCFISEATDILKQPRSSLLRQQIITPLETALGFFEDGIANQVDAFFIDAPNASVWECFSLSYRILPPLDVLIAKDSIRLYLKTFHALWHLRWCSYWLNDAWKVMRGMEVPRTLRFPLEELRHYMAFVVDTILSWAYTEVIGSAWNTLIEKLSNELLTIDEICSAHKIYIKSIHSKICGGLSKLLSLLKSCQNLCDIIENPVDDSEVLLEHIRSLRQTFADDIEGVISSSQDSDLAIRFHR